MGLTVPTVRIISNIMWQDIAPAGTEAIDIRRLAAWMV